MLHKSMLSLGIFGADRAMDQGSSQGYPSVVSELATKCSVEMQVFRLHSVQQNYNLLGDIAMICDLTSLPGDPYIAPLHAMI